jgi:hypothetical protein
MTLIGAANLFAEGAKDCIAIDASGASILIYKYVEFGAYDE